MSFKKAWGIPILTLDNYQELKNDPGLQPWGHANPVIDLDKYKELDLSDEQRGELRFAAKTEVVSLLNPKGGIFRGFRTVMKSWATTFCLLPGDYIVIVAEWKHGAEVLTLVPPSGVPSKIDEGSMDNCARREFVEESGIALERVMPLTPNGLPIASRGLTTRFHPYLGIPKMPLKIGPSKLDQNEHLKLFLVPLQDWIAMIHAGMTNEECAVSVTYLALERLGRLK